MYTPTMEDIAEGFVAGVTMASIIPVIYYGNKVALAALFAVNKAIGKALVRLILPSRENNIVPFETQLQQQRQRLRSIAQNSET